MKPAKRTASDRREDFQARYPRRALITEKQSRARRDGVPFDAELMLSIPCPDTCPVFGTEISFQRGVGARDPLHTASFDRIIPDRGYVCGNVQIISGKANTMKADASPNQLLRFAEWIIGEYGYLLPQPEMG